MARLLLLSVVVACTTSGALAQGGDENMEKIGSFAPPETSAEENDSVVLPRHLRCDGMCTAPATSRCSTVCTAACRAVTHVMTEQLRKMTEKPGSTYKTKKGKTRMKESVYLEVRVTPPA